MRRGFAAILLAGSVSIPARAHPGVNARIEAATTKIAADPDNAELYLRRGELHVEDAHFHAAKDDFNRAARLDPKLAKVDLLRGLMWVEAGKARKATKALGRFLAVKPDHAAGRFLRARAWTELGARQRALDDLDRAIANTDEPKPDAYLARVKLLSELDRVDEALEGVDAGIEALGRAVVLIEFAFDAEAKRGRTDPALARVAQLPEKLRTSPHWFKRSADLLHTADRDAEAVGYYVAALATAAALPPSRKAAPAVAKLSREARESLASLGS